MMIIKPVISWIVSAEIAGLRRLYIQKIRLECLGFLTIVLFELKTWRNERAKVSDIQMYR